MCCCCGKKKKSKKGYEDLEKQKFKSSPYPDSSVQNTNLTPNTTVNLIERPNYSSSVQPYNFGGTTELYQNVTPSRNSEMPPPTYQQTVNSAKTSDGYPNNLW